MDPMGRTPRQAAAAHPSVHVHVGWSSRRLPAAWACPPTCAPGACSVCVFWVSGGGGAPLSGFLQVVWRQCSVPRRVRKALRHHRPGSDPWPIPPSGQSPEPEPGIWWLCLCRKGWRGAPFGETAGLCTPSGKDKRAEHTQQGAQSPRETCAELPAVLGRRGGCTPHPGPPAPHQPSTPLRPTLLPGQNLPAGSGLQSRGRPSEGPITGTGAGGPAV